MNTPLTDIHQKQSASTIGDRLGRAYDFARTLEKRLYDVTSGISQEWECVIGPAGVREWRCIADNLDRPTTCDAIMGIRAETIDAGTKLTLNAILRHPTHELPDNPERRIRK